MLSNLSPWWALAAEWFLLLIYTVGTRLFQRSFRRPHRLLSLPVHGCSVSTYYLEHFSVSTAAASVAGKES